MPLLPVACQLLLLLRFSPLGGRKSPLSREERSLTLHVSAEKLAAQQRACLSAGAKNTRRRMHHMPGLRHALMKESSVLRGSRCLLSPGGLFNVPLLEAVRRKSSFGTTLCCFNSVSRARRGGFGTIMLSLGFLSIQLWKKASGICQRKMLVFLWIVVCS